MYSSTCNYVAIFKISPASSIQAQPPRIKTEKGRKGEQLQVSPACQGYHMEVDCPPGPRVKIPSNTPRASMLPYPVPLRDVCL
ncbi:uncharacterized protein LACBIDRAFT_316295 [Laccaria bicolor S238N-H82]|uniref:Predicted protein n=1 Tax=Laccaria bicolor (strain S238N-H82 / ATCC MYA-4686) TaxID=486041 RepID=B0E0N0_LACBS|nr:uncharacterized protein LACBIDRAFT_316295 [Laccaria bicolor S238N-H82]EDQ99644.1 predicted protein [Laccaria bicolor S238N-H82]|eukprot:XP_001889755.1 predicted protein [Laccaria bicolor S238N-H82]